MARTESQPNVASQIQSLMRRIERLESERTVTVVDAAPADAAPDGAQRVERVNTGRLWLRVGGAWRFVNLT